MEFSANTNNINICLFKGTKPIRSNNKPKYTNLNDEFPKYYNAHVQVSTVLSIVASMTVPTSSKIVERIENGISVVVPIFEISDNKIVKHCDNFTVELYNKVLEDSGALVWRTGRICVSQEYLHLRWSESNGYICPPWLKHINNKGKNCNTCNGIYRVFADNFDRLHEYTSEKFPKILINTRRKISEKKSFADICANKAQNDLPEVKVQEFEAQDDLPEVKVQEFEAQGGLPEVKMQEFEPVHEVCAVPPDLFHGTRHIQNIIAQMSDNKHIDKHDITFMIARIINNYGISLTSVKNYVDSFN